MEGRAEQHLVFADLASRPHVARCAPNKVDVAARLVHGFDISTAYIKSSFCVFRMCVLQPPSLRVNAFLLELFRNCSSGCPIEPQRFVQQQIRNCPVCFQTIVAPSDVFVQRSLLRLVGRFARVGGFSIL